MYIMLQHRLWRMVYSGMLRRVALVRTDVLEELSASFISMTRIGELGTTLAVTSNWGTLRRNASVLRLLVTARVLPSSPILVTLMKEALSSSETSVLTRATRRNIEEYTIHHSHRSENLKSYNTSYVFSSTEGTLRCKHRHTLVRHNCHAYKLSVFLGWSNVEDREGRCEI
jgi:hypothetical protein